MGEQVQIRSFQRSAFGVGMMPADGEKRPGDLLFPLAVTVGRCRPLLPVRGVVSLLGCDENRVLDLVEEGELLWAWNFALDRAGRTKELRILPQCVQDFNEATPCSVTWPEVLALVFAAGSEELTAADVSLGLNLSGTHVHNLIERGEIKTQCAARRGPNGSPPILISSVLHFLKRRRWPAPDLPG